MTTTDMTIAPAVLTGVAMMDAAEARQIVTRIKTRIDLARGELLDLHDREGWRALGYRNWEMCAREEFGHSAAQMYRLLSAAQIERAIDSPIGEYPESHLREVAKLDTPDQQKQALDRASAATNGKPTAKDVRQAAQEIGGSDVPPEYDIVKRRFAAFGITLLSNMQGHHRAFVTRKEGMTGVVTFDWADVLSKLERLEAEPPPAAIAPVGWVCEQCGATITDMKRPMTPICSTCVIRHQSDRATHLTKESRDSGRMLRARTLIGNGEYDAARTVLAGVEVSTYARDQLLATFPAGRQITLALTFDECAALLKEARMFSSSDLTKKLPTIGQALILMVEAIKGVAA